MKALSLLQPWATLVVKGAKQIETRSWRTSHRGALLIHASKGQGGKVLAYEVPFTKYIGNFEQLPFGYIIGKVTLTDVIRIGSGRLPDAIDGKKSILTREEKAFGDYSPGRFAWLLHDPIAFKMPIAAKGSLALWEFDEGLISEDMGCR